MTVRSLNQAGHATIALPAAARARYVCTQSQDLRLLPQEGADFRVQRCRSCLPTSRAAGCDDTARPAQNPAEWPLGRTDLILPQACCIDWAGESSNPMQADEARSQNRLLYSMVFSPIGDVTGRDVTGGLAGSISRVE